MLLLPFGGFDICVENLPHVHVQPTVDTGKAVVQCAKFHTVECLFRHYGLIDRRNKHRSILGLRCHFLAAAPEDVPCAVHDRGLSVLHGDAPVLRQPVFVLAPFHRGLMDAQ